MLDLVGPTFLVSSSHAMSRQMLKGLDSEEQKKEWQEDPAKHAQYCRDVEGELNKRFTLVSPTRLCSSRCLIDIP